jgi:Glycosyl transferases group 1/DUF based on E. rectale Gene description (DUF3880)
MTFMLSPERSNRVRVLIVYNGPVWGTGDVAVGLAHGLQAHGVTQAWSADQADVAIIVTAIRQPVVVDRLLAAGVPVVALFTESPYEAAAELAVAARVAGCWTHERTSVETFRTVNPHVAYLPHAWNPAVHTSTPQPGDTDMPAHDVVFVGAGVRERIAFFNAIDWTGIDLGLYGVWRDLGLKPQVEACIKSDGPISNLQAAALYRRADIGLNLYRRLPVIGPDRPTLRDVGQDRPTNWLKAESLNPRAYELAACGTCQLSEYRLEIQDIFGKDRVPTFKTPDEAAEFIRGTAVIGRDPDLQVCMAAHSWMHRAGQVLNDLAAWGLTDRATLARDTTLSR